MSNMLRRIRRNAVKVSLGTDRIRGTWVKMREEEKRNNRRAEMDNYFQYCKIRPYPAGR